LVDELLDGSFGVLLSVLKETQDLLEATVKLTEGLDLLLFAFGFDCLEVLVNFDAGFLVEGGLLDALSDFHDEILFIA
jgi:hypothetical protein